MIDWLVIGGICVCVWKLRHGFESREDLYFLLKVISDHNQPGTTLNAMICLRCLGPLKFHELVLRLCFWGAGNIRVFF